MTRDQLLMDLEDIAMDLSNFHINLQHSPTISQKCMETSKMYISEIMDRLNILHSTVEES